MFGYMFQVKMSDRFLETAERYLNRQNLWEPANDFAAAVGAFMVKDRARGQAVLEEMVHLARQKLDAARDTRGRRRFRHYLGDLANALDMFQIFSRSWIDRHVSSLRPEATPRPEAAEYDPQRGSRDIREGVQRQTIIHHQGGQQEVVIPQEVEDQLLATPSKTDEAAMDLGESPGIFLGTPSPPKTLHLPSERSLDVKEPVADSERSLELAPVQSSTVSSPSKAAAACSNVKTQPRRKHKPKKKNSDGASCTSIYTQVFKRKQSEGASCASRTVEPPRKHSEGSSCEFLASPPSRTVTTSSSRNLTISVQQQHSSPKKVRLCKDNLEEVRKSLEHQKTAGRRLKFC